MADHKIKLVLHGQSVKTMPDLSKLDYKVGDTFTFTSHAGAIRSQCSAPGAGGPWKDPIQMTAKIGESFETWPLPKQPFVCNCGLTLPDGTEVGWPKDEHSGSQTNGGN